MSEVCSSTGPEREPQPASERLLNYLRGQFVDAWSKETDEDDRGEEAPHGSFIQKVVPGLEPKHYRDEPVRRATRGSHRVVMKRPHPHDRRHDFYEVFAIGFTPEGAIDETEDGVNSTTFLVRRRIFYIPRPFQLVDEWGVRSFQGSFHDQVSFRDLDKFQENAETLLEKLEDRNIVASAE